MNDEDDIYFDLQAACKTVLQKGDINAPPLLDVRCDRSLSSNSNVHQFRAPKHSLSIHSTGCETTIDKHFIIKPLIEINKEEPCTDLVFDENELHQIDSMVNGMHRILHQVCCNNSCKNCRHAANEIPVKLTILRALQNAIKREQIENHVKRGNRNSGQNELKFACIKE